MYMHALAYPAIEQLFDCESNTIKVSLHPRTSSLSYLHQCLQETARSP